MRFADNTDGVPQAGLNWSPEPQTPVIVTIPDQASLLQDLETRLLAGEGFSVATLNLDHAVKLKQNPAFRAAYAAQTHVTADGNPIIWLLRLSGQRGVHLVTGSDSIQPAVALAARLGVPLGLFGSVEASLQTAATRLQKTYPGLEVPFQMSPAMGFDPEGADADAAIESIRQSGARMVLLALSAPKQEIFAIRAHQKLPGVGFLSIGASIDFVSGFQKRAPTWARNARIEWLWRLVRSPKRLGKRYLACIAAMPRLCIAALRHRSGKA